MIVHHLFRFTDVGNYIEKNGKLPGNFIKKNEAKLLGWDPKKGNLHEVAPGKSIGGDIFLNKEKNYLLLKEEYGMRQILIMFQALGVQKGYYIQMMV